MRMCTYRVSRIFEIPVDNVIRICRRRGFMGII